EPARWASLPKRAFRWRPCPLTRPSLLVGNIPDCAQRQKNNSKPSSLDFELVFDLKSTFEQRVKPDHHP
ncbi:hypothetical protein YPPY89_4739, partial [Yersinia pestis PY-89]